MRKRENAHYTFSFESSQSPASIFEVLQDVPRWWSGLYGEEIQGSSKNLNDEFTFRAGDGVHYSRQRLIDLVPGRKIGWEVTESNLSFLKKTEEWTNTKIGFEISIHNSRTKVTFTHQGLIPRIECYKSCAGAWTDYMENLAKQFCAHQEY